MSVLSPETLPPEVDIALAWCAPRVRAPLNTGFQLDRRLARIVARTTEPMLGQMRLAWWRDALEKQPDDRPRGDAVLDAISVHWAGREERLIAMVDAWELLITAETLGATEADAFGAQRGAFFSAACGVESGVTGDRAATVGFRWALADAAASVSDPAERAVLVDAGLARANRGGAFPSGCRGLAVLDALSLRALRGGGRPLMEGRRAPILALRAAIFGT